MPITASGGPLGRDEPVGGGEHVGGQPRHRGDGFRERVEVEQITGGDAQLLAGLPPHQLVQRVATDGRALVEHGEHRQRFRIGLQHAGQRSARPGHGDGGGDELGIVGEQLGGVRVRAARAHAGCRR